MILNKKNKVNYLSFDLYKDAPIVAVHSTRIGGVSKGCFSEMNLGFSRGDKREDVLENYKLFCEAIGVDHKKIVLSDQWHHNNIVEVTTSHQGMGIYKERSYKDVDGLITNMSGIPIVTFYADCVPIYYYGPDKKVVAMTHAGWKGTATGIVKDMIKLMVNKYGCCVDLIKIAIGPAVCKACYEVDKQVIDAMPYHFSEKHYEYYKEKDKYHIDLKNINRDIARDCGVSMENIEVTDCCTKCHPEWFFSHRRHGSDRGTQIGVMMLKE